MVWFFSPHLVPIGHVCAHVYVMDAVPQKANPIVSVNFILGLVLAGTLDIFQYWLGFTFYDEVKQQWLSPFQHAWIRFGIREIVVYVNLWVGYSLLRRIHPHTPLPIFFAILTIVLDLFFVLSGILRMLFPHFLPLVKQYSNLYYYLNTGILFVFFHALGLAWPTLSNSLFKEK